MVMDFFPGGVMTKERISCSAIDLRSWRERSLGYPGRRALEFLNLKGWESVIDAGSGSGFYAFRLAEVLREGKVLALDSSSEKLSALSRQVRDRKLNRCIEALECDLLDIPLADESADALLCMFTLNALLNPEEAMFEFHRILKPGGRIFLAERVPSDALSEGDGFLPGRGPVDLSGMRELLEEAGFRATEAFVHRRKVLAAGARKAY